jgi:hypothetical protein
MHAPIVVLMEWDARIFARSAELVIAGTVMLSHNNGEYMLVRQQG